MFVLERKSNLNDKSSCMAVSTDAISLTKWSSLTESAQWKPYRTDGLRAEDSLGVWLIYWVPSMEDV